MIGNWHSAEQLIATAKQQASALNDAKALADLFLLESAHYLEAGDMPTAQTAAEIARGYALQASAPMQYVSAAISISKFANAQEDWIGTFEALAAGWATLTNWLGQEVAQNTFKPKLLELRDRWGVEKFTTVKAAYEARQRVLMNQNE